MELGEQILARLLDEDLETWGFERSQIQQQLSQVDLEGAAVSRGRGLSAIPWSAGYWFACGATSSTTPSGGW